MGWYRTMLSETFRALGESHYLFSDVLFLQISHIIFLALCHLD